MSNDSKSFSVTLFPDGNSGQEDDSRWVARRTVLLLDGLSAICRELRNLGCPAPPEDWAERAARLRLLRDDALLRWARSGGVARKEETEAYAHACEIMGCEEALHSNKDDVP